MKRRYFWLDLETRCDLDLTKVGAEVYTAHPSLHPLMFAGAYDDSAPFLHDYIASGQDLPEEHKRALEDPAITKVAWNATFDFLVLKRFYPDLNLDITQWVDAMAWAYSLSLPGSLDKATMVLGLPHDDRKERDGKRLINLFCKPVKGGYRSPEDKPDDWSKFKSYAVQDVHSMRKAYYKMREHLKFTYTKAEHELWLVDQEINRAGLPVDMDYARHAVEFDRQYKAERFAQAQKITGMDNPTAPQQLQRWLVDQGVELPNMQAQTLRNYIADNKLTLNHDVQEAIEIRLELSRTSNSKFQTILDRANDRGCVCDAFQYYGAHTGRWAGRGVQLHNLPAGNISGSSPEDTLAKMEECMALVTAGDSEMVSMLYGDVGMALSSTVRPTFAAPAGYKFLVADYSSIETAVIAWLANCTPLLDLMHRGGDPYKDMATEIFSVDYTAVTKTERTYCKPIVLGGVFGLGGKGYQGYAAGYGVELDEEESQHVVDVFRHRYPEIPRWWGELKSACFRTLSGTFNSMWSAGEHIEFFRADEDFVFARLPSGRALAYPYARSEMVEHPEFGPLKQFVYEGIVKGQWVDIHSHPGKLAENMTQAVARDLLAEGLQNARLYGFETVAHVHDEIITLVPEDDKFLTLQNLIGAMTILPPWAEGIPLRADGYETTRYLKD